MKYVIFCFLLTLPGLISAQQSSKSKSKDRFREKNDRHYPVRVTNAGDINGEGADFAPAYFKEGIVFVSARAGNGPRDPKTGEAFTALYYAFFNYNGEPGLPQQVAFGLKKKSDFSEGPACFSRDYKTVFLTLPNHQDGLLKAGKNGKIVLKICESRYGKPDWTKPLELPFNSDDYSCMHPSLSADGTKLFFASDMSGGQGGYDIYAVERRAGGWGAPVNLGPVVNTARQEIFPFISQSGTLFFSSNGRSNTLGGFDNYYINNPLDNPEEVVNLGDEFNSAADDMSFIINNEGKNGFFSSNRPRGMGKDDIYRFEAPLGLEGIGKAETTPVQITVVDAKTGRPLRSAEIRILRPSGDGFEGNGKDFALAQDEPNAPGLQLSKNAGDLGTPDYYSNAEGKAQLELTRYQSYFIAVSLPGYGSKQRFVSIDLENPLALYFKLTEVQPCLKAGGIVATTAFGTRILNATVRFVHRMSGQSVEVRTNWSGEYDACLPLEGDYVVYVSRPGFRETNFRLNASVNNRVFNEIRLEALDPAANVEATMPLANDIQEGTVIVLDKLFRGYNSATLDKGAEDHLNAIFELLQRYPNMEIDLIAHTDTRGEARLNQELSAVRARKIRDYLLSRGVAAGRVAAYGKGESEPRNRCAEGVECSDEEHAQNNRVEVRVRKLK